MKAFFTRHKVAFSICLSFVFWIGVWQLLSFVYGMDFILPSPLQTLKELCRTVIRPAFWGEIFYSVFHILLGFFIAATAGILLAFAGIRLKMIRVLFDPFCSVIRAVPVVSFIVLVLVMFPTGTVSTVISALMGFPVLYATVSASLDEAPRELLDVCRVYGFGFMRTLRTVYLPHIRPTLSSSLSVALGLCFKSGIAAEVIGIPAGSVGNAIYHTKISFDMPSLFSYTAVTVCISVLLERLIRRLLLIKPVNGGKRSYEQN